MDLKKNIFANYVSQIYVTIIGIVMVPMYVKYMGAEAYGLVGFYAMLQAWFQLLDMGLTPTMARETARFNGGESEAINLRHLLRALEVIFIATALVGGGCMILGAEYIAGSWLKVQHLSLATVEEAIVLMAVIVALRWISGLYRGAINGFERLVWLSSFNMAMATARFVFVIPLFIYFGTSLKLFFTYQLIIAFCEVVFLFSKTYSLLPTVYSNAKHPLQWGPLRGVLKFSLTIAFTSTIWIVVTQTDKLVLSKLLPLQEYAFFTLAVLVASGVMAISSPISAVLLPRMTKINALGDGEGLIKIYREASQFVAVVAIPASLVLAFFSEQILWAWTGDMTIAHNAAPVLSLYAIGNGILAISAFPYYLQFAKGDLKLHLIGNALFIVLLIPMLMFLTVKYGAIGAGYAWVISNLLYLLFWIPKVHGRFVRGLHIKWLLKDIGVIFILVLMTTSLIKSVVSLSDSNRALTAGGVVMVSIVLFLIAALGSSKFRDYITAKYWA